jgi:hypothetical protein
VASSLVGICAGEVSSWSRAAQLIIGSCVIAPKRVHLYGVSSLVGGSQWIARAKDQCLLMPQLDMDSIEETWLSCVSSNLRRLLLAN